MLDQGQWKKLKKEQGQPFLGQKEATGLLLCMRVR